LSEEKKKKICEQALELLYSNYPTPLFTVEIARELARDEEFMKKTLESLEERGLLKKIRTGPNGAEYLERTRWVLAPAAKEKYDELA